MMPALETQSLTIGYRRRGKPDVVLARGLNLELQRGKLVGLLGPNGVGKSTLLRTLAGMHKQLAGQVLVSGRDAATLAPLAMARQLSLVLTAAPQPSLMNGYALVALGRHPHSDWLGRMTADDHRIVAWAIGAVSGDDLADRPLAELSDGQRQKLMIARALAQEADVMLLDEPTAYLDLPRRVETMQLLKHLARSTERAILVSTHDLELALRSCDRLWLMSEGCIETGAPEDLVLDGSLSEAFHTDGISFDRSSGTFVLDPQCGRAVSVQGDSIDAQWMRRALERAGFLLQEAPCLIEITHHHKGSGRAWRLRLNGHTSSHGTIQAVLDALESEQT